jgi:hypothetical protein
VAIQSYLPERAGGLVAAGAFASEEAAAAAVRMLRQVGMRWQDIVVLTKDARRAQRVARDNGAWTPRRTGILPFSPRIPRSIKRRYGGALSEGGVIVIVAEDGQKSDTLAAVLERAGAVKVMTWWQEPSGLFPPPEMGGPL